MLVELSVAVSGIKATSDIVKGIGSALREIKPLRKSCGRSRVWRLRCYADDKFGSRDFASRHAVLRRAECPIPIWTSLKR